MRKMTTMMKNFIFSTFSPGEGVRGGTDPRSAIVTAVACKIDFPLRPWTTPFPNGDFDIEAELKISTASSVRLQATCFVIPISKPEMFVTEFRTTVSGGFIPEITLHQESCAAVQM